MRIIIFNLCFFLCGILYSQELPPITHYAPDDYGGDNQNWMLSQAPNEFIYVANNKGLLEFNGAKWTLYESPNNTITRAVKVVGDRVYTGCYSDFGYWERGDNGILHYTSMVALLTDNSFEDEQIWNIVEYGSLVIFQSNRALYFYNSQTNEFSETTSENLIYRPFNVENDIYYHVANEGIYKFENGLPKLLLEENRFKGDRIIHMSAQSNGLVLITRNSGILQFENDQLSDWSLQANQFLKDKSVFSAVRLKDGSFLIGTISHGLIHFDSEGNLLYNITQKRGLGNNTVLSLFEDADHNVWAGLDNGIDCINETSAIKTFFDYDGVLGTVYASIVHKGTLYLGTNQGLFYRTYDSNSDGFRFVQGTAGQVLSLFEYKDDLLCGHHLGTFLVNGDQVEIIGNQLGTWKFEPVKGDATKLLQGNYSGLYLLSKETGNWSINHKIEGFNDSARYFEFLNDTEVIVSHEYKGVFKLSLDSQLTKVEEVTVLDTLPLSKNSSLSKFQGDVLYATDQGVFRLDKQSATVEKDSILSDFMEDDHYVSGKMVHDDSGRLWLFTKDNINYIATDHVTNTPRLYQIAVPDYLRKGALGYENIASIDDDKMLLGTSNGYLKLDLSKIDQTERETLFLNAMILEKLNGSKEVLSEKEDTQLNYRESAVIFEFSVPNYEKYREVNYRYRLKGLQEQWSRWQTDASAKFENLSFGSYSFQVQAKVGNQIVSNEHELEFSVARPWYLSNLALAIYFLLLLIILFVTHKAYKRYYRKELEHKQLESQQIIMEINNEKLNQEIDSKNRELAISTMSIIKKNEVLNKIKKELKKSGNRSDTKGAIDLIDSSLNNTKDWKFFKQAFNNADKDFLDKIKAAHPELTPNDLRFCAYLRLNLASKEIAPLLNISTKSVETKRYRLRKRLNLDHDQSLVNYILKF